MASELIVAMLAAVAILPAQVLPPTCTYDVVSVRRSDPAERNSGFGPVLRDRFGLVLRAETRDLQLAVESSQ